MSEVEGLFETIFVRAGTPLRLNEHLGRLRRSAAALGLLIEETPDEIRRKCEGLPDGRLRLALAAGGITASLHPFVGYAEELYQEGVMVLLAEQPGHPLGKRAGHKSLPYDLMIDARDRAKARGATEVLFTDTDGAILEGSVSNVFVVLAGVLVTPPLTRPILPGVTRAAVLSAAAELGVDTREADLYPADLVRAEAAFLTSSLMLALPIRQIGALEIPGIALAEEFRALLV